MGLGRNKAKTILQVKVMTMQDVIKMAYARPQERPPSEMPSVPQMARNLARDGIKWILSGMEMASSEVVAQRLSLCKACEFYIGERCSRCGCQMRVKTTLATSSCPVGKWGQATEKMVPIETQTNPPAF